MEEENIKYICKIAAIPLLCVIVMICIVLYVVNKDDAEDQLNKENESITIDYKSDENYMDQLDKLAISLSIPTDVLERSFPELRSYIGGVLQSANYGYDLNKLNFELEPLDGFLKHVNYWKSNQEEFGTKEKCTDELDKAGSLDEKEIEKYTDEDFSSGYKKYIMREQFEYLPKINNRLEYDNQIIYILQNKHNKHVITFDIPGNSYIKSYKVVSGA